LGWIKFRKSPLLFQDNFRGFQFLKDHPDLLQKNAVIKRVFERGNEIEKKEIIHFYGKEYIKDLLNAHWK
jgi:hypothetical protein